MNSEQPSTETVTALVDCLRYRPVATTAAQMREAADLIESYRLRVAAAKLLASAADKLLSVVHSQLENSHCTCGEKAKDDYTDCDWHQAFDLGIACQEALAKFRSST